MKRMFALALCLGLFLSGCGAGETESQAQEASRQFFAMDTYMELRAYGAGAEKALETAETQIQQLEKLLSVTEEESEIYAINHSGGTPTAVSEDTETVLSKALALGAATGGALSVTMYPVSRAWGFTTGEYQVPEEAELERLLANVDDSRVTVENGTVTIPAEAEVDLGAVAKGYAGDLAAVLLQEAGVTSALLNLGSSTIRTIGTKPDGSNWRIAIQDPQNSEGYAGVIELGEGAVDTSGGYQRYFTGEDGTVYWHILDPATGYPAKNGLISVTVVTQDACTGDGLSTALFVMGLDQAIDYWRETGDFEFVLIADDGALYASEGVSFTPMGSYEGAEVTVITKEG